MFTRKHVLLVLTMSISALLLAACEEKKATDTPAEKTEQVATTEQAKSTEQATEKTTTTDNNTANLNTAVTEEKIETPAVPEKTAEADPNKVEEISWDKLIPESYDPSVIIDKYSEELASLTDDDPKAMELYGKIQAELDNAPVNMSLDGKTIKMPGFIAPLENNNGIISEFLLVPYFGACIHVPAPPINQTVMIKAKNGQGIKSEESSLPIWITGKLKAVEERTSIGAAGYRIENAQIEPYTEE